MRHSCDQIAGVDGWFQKAMFITIFKTDNIAIYMGSDFTYENAEIWFSNIDKLIKYKYLRILIRN